ncbi:MAG: Sensory/regulatory protein RpfC [Bacteroidetes bacterium ADurb.Bin408]|nr:MAG: Sensory/regulatory protein RpfC [Bacteroidetes bacterium ADurb.Bin408]
MILEHMLSYWGIKFTGCDNGLAALNIMEKQNDFDVLIVDYQMPYMDGLETIKLIKNRIGLNVEKQPVILLHSSIDYSKVRDECRKMGIRYNIIKPVKSSDLFEYLNNIFEPETLLNEAGQISAEQNFKTSRPLSLHEHIILVAEDVPLNLEVIRALLHNILPASHILTAKNGRDVIEYVL